LTTDDYGISGLEQGYMWGGVTTIIDKFPTTSRFAPARLAVQQTQTSAGLDAMIGRRKKFPYRN